MRPFEKASFVTSTVMLIAFVFNLVHIPIEKASLIVDVFNLQVLIRSDDKSSAGRKSPFEVPIAVYFCDRGKG